MQTDLLERQDAVGREPGLRFWTEPQPGIVGVKGVVEQAEQFEVIDPLDLGSKACLEAEVEGVTALAEHFGFMDFCGSER